MFEMLIESNFINFAIMISLLALIFKKFKLGALIDKMADDTRRKIAESKKNAEDALSEYESTKEGVKDVIKKQAEIINNAKETALGMEKNIERETEICMQELDESFNALVESYNIKAKKQTVAQVYDACINLAKEYVEKSLDKETHKHLINKGIDDITKMDGICL